MKKADQIRNMLHKEFCRNLLMGTLFAFMGRHIIGSRSVWMDDVSKLLGYDSMKRKNSGFVPLPQLRTESGQRILKKLLAAYEEDRPIGNLDYQNKLLASGGWLCPCGRANPKYTYTCVCGRSKQATAASQETPSVESQSGHSSCWYCLCGKANSTRSAVCTCGRKKQDVPISQRYPSTREKTWLCTCGRENPNYTTTCVCGKNKQDIPKTRA